jgi:hypothetical protein
LERGVPGLERRISSLEQDVSFLEWCIAGWKSGISCLNQHFQNLERRPSN